MDVDALDLPMDVDALDAKGKGKYKGKGKAGGKRPWDAGCGAGG